MARYLLHAMGSDRPGIVAGVTGVLADAGCNLEDSRMSILHGQFVVMLVVETPNGLSGEALDGAFLEARRDLDLDIVIRPIPESVPAATPARVVAVSVHGADRPGIVAAFTKRVADLGGNIIDVSTHRSGEGADAEYVLLFSVELRGDVEEDALRDALTQVSSQLGVTSVVHAGDDDLF